MKPKPDLIACGAYHEAAHAVMAYIHGGWVNQEGIEIAGVGPGTRDYAGYSFQSIFSYTWAVAIQISIAGRMAELKFAGMNCLRMTERLEYFIDDLRLCDGEDSEGDDREVFEILIGQYPEASDEELIRFYREYEKDTLKYLDDPDVWSSIKAVVDRLLEKGKLSQGEVEEVLIECGFLVSSAALMEPSKSHASPATEHAKAVKNRDDMAKEMTPAQIAEFKRLAREWMEKHKR